MPTERADTHKLTTVAIRVAVLCKLIDLCDINLYRVIPLPKPGDVAEKIWSGPTAAGLSPCWLPPLRERGAAA
jgi:hypothetical protein